MHTTANASTPTEVDEEGIIPFLIVKGADQGLAPTVPRTGPIFNPVENMEEIFLPELEYAQESDNLCQDKLRDIEETRGAQKVREYSWYAGVILSCRITEKQDSKICWLAPAIMRERILTLGHFSSLAAHPGVKKT